MDKNFLKTKKKEEKEKKRKVITFIFENFEILTEIPRHFDFFSLRIPCLLPPDFFMF